jgi:hypothetical protein
VVGIGQGLRKGEVRSYENVGRAATEVTGVWEMGAGEVGFQVWNGRGIRGSGLRIGESGGHGLGATELAGDRSGFGVR